MSSESSTPAVLNDWEDSHAALVGRRSGPAPAIPPSGSFWNGSVKAEIKKQPDGYKWILISGDGRFQLAQSPQVFPKSEDCEKHLRSFSPNVQVISGSSKSS